MIDPDNIDVVAAAGFKLLAESRVFEKQIEAEFRRLIGPDQSESDETLVNRIKEYRIRAGIFESLHALGLEIKQKESEQ